MDYKIVWLSFVTEGKIMASIGAECKILASPRELKLMVYQTKVLLCRV